MTPAAPQTPTSLARTCSRHVLVYLLVGASMASLWHGLHLPTIEMKEIVFWKHQFSILEGIQSLYQEKYYFLAGIIFLFSIIFPIAKLFMLCVVWVIPMGGRVRKFLIGLLEETGKWSMLDVFVVAMMVIITRSSKLLHARPMEGIYWFAGSVILSMLAGSYIKYLDRQRSRSTLS